MADYWRTGCPARSGERWRGRGRIQPLPQRM